MASLEDAGKTKRPSNSAFKQQKLPAWQPILTAGTVLPTFFIIGLAFIPIGIGLLFSSNQVQEFQYDYTYCESTDPKHVDEKNQRRTCADVIAENATLLCGCEIPFNLTEDFKADVYVYYGLSNFYQNHRRYVKSRSDSQLLGNLDQVDDCGPFDKRDGKKIAPCGAIANSLFNDTLEIKRKNCPAGKTRSGQCDVPLLTHGIAWQTDKNVKFQNPDNMDEFKKYAAPYNWPLPIEERFTEEGNKALKNEDLIVWMRTAALPTFRKMYRRVNHDKEGYKNNLQKGQYILSVQYAYPVANFGGTKRIILSNTSWLGGKNPFLGYAYIVVGTICLLFAVVFVIIHNKFGKSTHELVSITQRTAY